MKDKKSSESRRKLLKSLAAGSGAIVAGKSLPESWSKPVVDSVMLPAHALTSQTCPIDITYDINVSGGVVDGSYSYAIFTYPGGVPEVGPVEGNYTSTFNQTFSHALAPGQYVVSGGTGADSDGSSAANGQTTVSCCSASSLLGTPWSFIAGEGDGDGGSVLVTVGADGTCTVEPSMGMDSDRNIKANFADVDEQEILNKVANLSIESWNYTDRDLGVRHIGPMAQDFMASFNVGGSDKVINMVDANGVNMAAIKALNSKLEEKDAQIQELQSRLDEVMVRLDKLT